MDRLRRAWGLAHFAFAAVFAGVLLAYLTPLGSPKLRVGVASYASILLFPPLIWVLLLRRAVDAKHLEARRFWTLWTSFFALWLVAEVLIALVPEDTPFLALGSDVLYLGSYLALALAVLQKPHEPSGWSTRSGSARFTAAAATLFLAGMLAYFVVVPFFADPESYATFVPTFYLFLILDALLAACFAYLGFRTRARGWRAIYGVMALAMTLWCVGDLVDYLYFSEAFVLAHGTTWDLFFYTPVVVIFLTTLVHVEPVRSEAWSELFETRRESDEIPSALPLAMAFLFPLLHLSVDGLKFLGEPSRDAREITVSVSLLALLALMFVQQRFLNRRNRALRSQVAVLVTNEQVLQAQKMEALGRLAGSVAHEFNNALLVIRGYSDLVLNQLPDGDPMRDDLENIGSSADHVASLTRDLMAFGRRQPRNASFVDLSQELERCEDMLQRVTGDDIQLVYRLEPDLQRVEIDPGQVVQVVMNLVVNARAAMPGGGRLTIETYNATLTGTPHAGEYVILRVKDTGVGMDKETRERMFEPFFTTKDGGIGLGLATVHGIVSQCGGHVKVTTESGSGTVFKLYFPASRSALPAVDEGPPDRVRSECGKETILLVEDEAGVRELTHRFLEKRGYDVLVAADGHEALRIAEAQEDVRLLLTDVVMPGLGGRELYERIASPNMGVVFMSGYAAEEKPLVPADREVPWAFLQKPFRMEDLEETLRQVLDKTPT